MGNKSLPGIAAEDIGKVAFAIFKGGREYIGKTIAIAGEHLTGKEMAAEMSKFFGVPIRYDSPSHAAYRSFGFPGADDLGNMFQFKHDFESIFRAPRDVVRTRRLDPELQTFAQFLARNKEKIALG
jgi:hypothetical protein